MANTYMIDQNKLECQYKEVARERCHKELKDLNPYELNVVIAEIVKEHVIKAEMEKGMNLFSEKRIAVYFSMEFLMGRLVLDALNNSGLMEVTSQIFANNGIDIKCLEDIGNAALGNGGLGRLAACFIESAATLGYPLYGVGLYYKYGLFKQQFDNDGQQVEIPDNWAENGDVWFTPIHDQSVIVEYQDTKVKATPYVMPIIGYSGDKAQFESNVFPLTLWKAETIEGVTNDSASKISDYLYPNDETDEGKILRIRQEYFFVSATLQWLFKKHLEKHGTLDNIEDYYIFQMNDTHPVFGCLEFIRLLKDYGYSFKSAYEKAKKCFAYTNHTIMSEALEKWPMDPFKNILPKVFKVIEELNQELIDELLQKDEFHFTHPTPNGIVRTAPKWRLIDNYELFKDKIIHMSRIACFIACKINGVAAVHTEIIQNETLKIWYELYPDKFNNKTNGVTPRHWIKIANKELADFLDRYVGTDWITNPTRLEELEQYKNNHDVLTEFALVKRSAKESLARYIEKQEGIRIDPNSIIDCQVKRIHEYKRQLMNALRILYIYDQLKKGNLPNFYKTTFIIGGKAAKSYKTAKLIIQLFKDIEQMVNNDSDVNDKMQVVFITNFNVSYAEKIYPGSNFSEQISTSGTEASGTGNMKFMMNGAPTIGTMDGANIEIVNESALKNNYIFGATVEEFQRIAPFYNHRQFLSQNGDLVELIDYLKGQRNLKNSYWDLVNTLLYDDKYFVMYDLRAYIETTLRANRDYALEQKTGDLTHYTRKGFKNTTHSGKFSSDRTVTEYAKEIWHIEPIK